MPTRIPRPSRQNARNLRVLVNFSSLSLGRHVHERDLPDGLSMELSFRAVSEYVTQFLKDVNQHRVVSITHVPGHHS